MYLISAELLFPMSIARFLVVFCASSGVELPPSRLIMCESHLVTTPTCIWSLPLRPYLITDGLAVRRPRTMGGISARTANHEDLPTSASYQVIGF